MGSLRPNTFMSHKKAVGWPQAGGDLAVMSVICLMTEPVLGWVEVGEGCRQLLPQFQPLPEHLGSCQEHGCTAGPLESEAVALNFLEHAACLCTCNSHL